MNHWDTRYANPEYAYGKEPNVFFKEQLLKLPAGTLLLPAEGEGRNGVYAAQQGWKVTAFDTSSEGRKKAMMLADEARVAMEYLHGDMTLPELAGRTFDAVGLIYAHQPEDSRKAFHQWAWERVKPGGYLILEGFHLENLPLRNQNPAIGGPDNPHMLFTETMLASDFAGAIMVELKKEFVELNEGLYHQGTACVLRLVAKKENPSPC